ncbi:hypothetical protein PV04_03178 [Phialophora macrospora]|uniref:Myb-like DNA-binding domain-containing protein n=1 Tax=Phialophora macrospora TaxID=1851006 RepID=A0A0D2D0I3_9EURO|nr:hypothetical protein PV04_03178 [Phialophora macrospora]
MATWKTRAIQLLTWSEPGFELVSDSAAFHARQTGGLAAPNTRAQAPLFPTEVEALTTKSNVPPFPVTPLPQPAVYIMAPNTEATGRKAKPSTGGEVFLKACIKYAKEKPSIDYDAVAQETGMSVGGAANKVRGFLKELEDAGAAWVKKDGNQATVGAKDVVAAGTKRKRTAKKNAKDDASNDDAAKISEDDIASATEPAKKKQARGKGTIKDKIGMNKDKGKEVVVAVPEKEPAKKKPAHGKAPAKAMQPAPTINSEDEGEELSDAAGKKKVKPAKKRAAPKAKAKTTISAPTSADEDEDVAAASDSAAAETLTKPKPTVVKPFTRKELPAIQLVDVRSKIVKTETVPERKPEPFDLDGDELDSADKE